MKNETEQLKKSPVLVRSGSQWAVNKGLFERLLALSMEIDYNYIPMALKRRMSFEFMYDTFFELDIDTEILFEQVGICDILTILAKHTERLNDRFSFMVAELCVLRNLALNHCRLYVNRTTTERLNYKLF